MELVITNHAAQRINERGFTIKQIANTLKHGNVFAHRDNDGKKVYHNKQDNVFIIMNDNVMITIFRKEY